MSKLPPLVLVVGLQKSGTSMLMRLLEASGAFRNPVKFEGKELWGDDPPFAPEAFPAGTLYQAHDGQRGHELGIAEATDEVVDHLRRGVGALRPRRREPRGVVLKNPYNTVRVPWLRAALPEALIVAVVRRPAANVFSLVKKHAENPHVHRGPEEGWWGVKPAGWRGLLDTDAVVQCAQQWERVNAKLATDRAGVDHLVRYHELCADPQGEVSTICEATLGRVPDLDLPALEPQDDEQLTGGPLESANKVYKRTGGLDLAGAERAPERLEPFTDTERARIEEICAATASELGLRE